jgi:hypothetical protein
VGVTVRRRRDRGDETLEACSNASSPAPASIARFNELASRIPVTLALADRGAPMIAGEDPHGDLLYLLWSNFFGDPASSRLPGPAWARLKHCSICRRWFADETKNRTQRWCSEPCHTRAWSRSARRAAGHKQYAKRKGARR